MSENSSIQNYHTNTMNKIEQLQNLETYLWANMNKLNDDGTSNSANNEIQSRIRDLKAMRINLLRQLNNMYVEQQDRLAVSRSYLVNQQVTGDVLDTSIDNLQSNINKLKAEKNNKLRLLKLTEYEHLRSKSHKNILKILSYALLIILSMIFMMGYSWFPTIIGTCVIIITIAVVIIYLGKELVDNFTRSNLYWHKFQQGDNKQFMKSTINTNTGDRRGFLSSLFSNTCGDNVKYMSDVYNRSKSGTVNIETNTPA